MADTKLSEDILLRLPGDIETFTDVRGSVLLDWATGAALLEDDLAAAKRDLQAANAEVNPLRQKASRVDLMEEELKQVHAGAEASAHEIVKWRGEAEAAQSRLAAMDALDDAELVALREKAEAYLAKGTCGMMMDLEQWIALLDRLATAEAGLKALADELAPSEECPFSTEQGCPRPDDKPTGFDNGRCYKEDRRGRHGAECWRLWAEKCVQAADALRAQEAKG